MPPESATHRAFNPDAGAQWTRQEQLIGLVVDQLRSRLWQAGGGTGRRPEPIYQPDRHEETIGSGSYTIEQLRERLGMDEPRTSEGGD